MAETEHAAKAAFDSPYTEPAAAVREITSRWPNNLARPRIAIVCGSGLGELQESVATAPSPRYEVAYADIPHCPRPSVQGHEGKLVFGLMGREKVSVVLLVGRAHYYEGHSMQLVTFMTRVCRLLEVSTLIVTNAAGGLNPSYNPGDIMLLSDHLSFASLAGASPLVGPNDESIGPRFPPLSDAYDLDLRRRAWHVWRGMEAFSSHEPSTTTSSEGPASSLLTSTTSPTDRTNPPHAKIVPPQARQLHEGTYAHVIGPCYETRAEARFLRAFADAVGMSTVPEVQVARHAGMRVLALSLITNSVVCEKGVRGDDDRLKALGAEGCRELERKGRAGHEEVVAAGREGAETVIRLLVGVVEGLAKEENEEEEVVAAVGAR